MTALVRAAARFAPASRFSAVCCGTVPAASACPSDISPLSDPGLHPASAAIATTAPIIGAAPTIRHLLTISDSVPSTGAVEAVTQHIGARFPLAAQPLPTCDL